MRKASMLAAVMISQPESWAHRKLNPDWQWGLLHNQWGVNTHDSVRWLQWAKTKDAQRGRNMPQPFPRPWDKKEPEYEVLSVDVLEARLEQARSEEWQDGELR